MVNIEAVKKNLQKVEIDRLLDTYRSHIQIDCIHKSDFEEWNDNNMIISLICDEIKRRCNDSASH